MRLALNRLLARPHQPDRITITTPDGPVAVAIRVSDRARRINLRVSGDGGDCELVVPARTSVARAVQFAESQALWLAARRRLARRPIPFAAGESVPVLGAPHVIIAATAGPPVARTNGELLITGDPRHHRGRLTEWFRRLALVEIAPRAERFAAEVDRPLGRITIRDPKTRWGSCSSRGDLSFSWRLAMAPPPVLDYVVAHEVAHLVELNHSPRFWRVVDSLNVDAAGGRRWLKTHGRDLHRHG
jgi:hypothetical protein